MQATALIVSDVNTIAPGAVEIPAPESGEVLVQAHYTGVSPGTELRKMTGVEGDAFPYLPGYALSGTVAEVGPDVTEFQVGDRVFCSGTARASVKRLWGGHTAFAVRAAERIYRLPENVDLVSAAILPMANIAWHGVRLAKPQSGESVVVIGLGPIGQCAARLYKATGAQTLALDLSPERVEIARAAGVDARVPEGTLSEAVRRVFPTGADVVVDCTGSNAVLPQSVLCARELPWNDDPIPGARFLIQGSYPSTFTMPYPECFQRELQILVPRDYQPHDVATVLQLLAEEKVSLNNLVSAVRKPEEAQATYDELRSAKGALITAVFDWR